jgi:putative addiction module component (TIGR02574 family)
MNLKAILEAAKNLSREDRASLIEELILIDTDLTPAQARDLDRRIDELESGKAKLIPGEIVMERLRRREESN